MSDLLMCIEESKQSPAQRVSIGQRVMVTCPEFVQRVGYPMSFEDAITHVEENMKDEIQALLDKTSIWSLPSKSSIFNQDHWPPRRPYYLPYLQLVKALARMYMASQGYGGRDRTIHVNRYQDRLGRTYEVTGKQVVYTGYYEYSTTSRDWETGEVDYEPPYLSDRKAHVLLQLNTMEVMELWQSHDMFRFPGVWIEACNVRLLK